MSEWLRESLAEDMGYRICPLAPEAYIICDKKCDNCEYHIDFIKSLDERSCSNEEFIKE